MGPAAGELVRFSMVGCVGFAVDAGLTLFLTQGLLWSPTISRIVAFVLAASITWALNRRFTFRSSTGRGTWLTYVAFTSFGALINVGTYLAWIQIAGTQAIMILLGVALGSGVGLGFNFWASRRLVFVNR